jgi:hypothetical protein
MSRFRAGRRGEVTVGLDPLETALLTDLLEQLLALLDQDAADGGGEAPEASDPLAAELGIGTATAPPADPALARLLPDAYRDDPESAADFRRYTEPELREAKRTAARTTLATLAEQGRRRRLTAEQAQAWLTALNDLRLTLGTRLEVTEDWDQQVAELPPGDPRLYGFAVYDHLTGMQEELVQALLRAG